VSIDTSPAFIREVADHLPRARITSTNSMSSPTPRLPSIRPGGLNSDAILDSKDCAGHDSRTASGYPPKRVDLDALISHAATKRTASAWLYREGLRDILDRKQINVVAAMLKQWCTNVLRSKSLPSRRRGSSR
jgi:hypothetical protein